MIRTRTKENEHTWMVFVAILCLSFCVIEETETLKHLHGSDYSKGARFRRSPQRLLDHSCDGFDCSQKKRAEFVTDHEFTCKVGMHEECNVVNRMMNDELKDVNNGNYAKLSHFHIFNKLNRTLYNGTYKSLNYSISLPHEDEGGLKATMIMTLFSSKQDLYYSKRPICRVFNFSSSKLTNNDLIKPRVINYPCLFGLDDILSMIDYTLNITVIPYQASLFYYLQIYSPDSKKYSCPVNNGIAVLNLQQTLHVVFESIPGALNYTLVLYKDSQVHETIEVNRNENHHEFLLKVGGEYKIGIKPTVLGKNCKETLTKSVIWKVEVQHVLDKKQSYVDLVAIILPFGFVIVSLIAGTVLLVQRYRRKQKERAVAERSARLYENLSNHDELSIPYHLINN